jgi:hypothetical protein
MPTERKARYTIGQVMVIIAIIACACAVLQVLRPPQSPGTTYLLSSLVLLVAGVAALHTLVNKMIGFTCPACHRPALRRMARHRRYYRCSACRARFKRFRFGAWLDASGPEDADKFGKPGGAGTWEGYEMPTDLEGTATGHLLQDKRSGDWQELVPQPPHVEGPDRRSWDAQQRVRAILARLQSGEDPTEGTGR